LSTYEAVFILNDRKFEDNGTAFADEIAAHIQSLGGKVAEKKCLGRRQFARMIKKLKAGTYWDFVFSVEPDQVETFKDKYRLNAAVLRLEVFIYEPPPANLPKDEADA